jgi:hypothetical protein
LTRAGWAALFALLLALRLLSPAGFMPEFRAGAVTIIACPDADLVSIAHHGAAAHHHGKKAPHQPCPYASASANGIAAADLPLLVGALLAGVALLLGRPSAFIERHRRHRRPPLRGPPLPA